METEFHPLTFGEWLKRRRLALYLKQGELAQQAGCSVSGLRKLETGERRPSKELASLLAYALDIGPELEPVFVRVARGELAVDRLGDPVRVGRTAFRPVPEAAIQTTLPLSPTPLVGRRAELNALSDLLADRACRLLTLIGPGGIGKTRLAVEVAEHVATRFSDGVTFVPLAQSSDAAFLVPAIADALNLTFQGQTEARTQLISYLRGRRQLLLLDNAEHLLDGTALFAEIIACAPGVKLLVTSRERLDLRGEWVYELEGLPVPAAGAESGIESYSSIALFLQSARRARADFELREADRPCVTHICRLLEGTPLGIELAASWVFTLSCCEIAQQIEQSLDFLVTSKRDVPERQRSLRAAFEHSWGLLPAEEQRVLCRLAVFQGGFEREAAEWVAGASPPLMLALASKSLVRRRKNGRFDLHEVVRQYAYAYLAEDPEGAATGDRHCNYYLRLLTRCERDLKSGSQRETLRMLTEEIGNIRTAWAWAIQRRQMALVGDALRSYGWMCEIGGRLREGIAELDLVVQALRGRHSERDSARVLSKALAQQGLLYFRLGEFETAMRAFDESLTLARPLADPALLVDALILGGIILHLCGDYDGSLARIREGGACARAAGDTWFEIYARYNEGYIASLNGRHQEGYDLMSPALAEWRAIADPRSTALGLNYLVPTLVRLNRLDEAKAYLDESVNLCEVLGDRWGLGTAYRMQGLVALARGESKAARDWIDQSLEVFSGFVIGWDVVQSIFYLGECAAIEGNDREAAEFYRAALLGALEARSAAQTLCALRGLADVKLLAGDDRAALAIALFVVRHPASAQETREKAERIVCTTGDRLGRMELEALQDAVSCWRLEQVAAAAIADVPCPPADNYNRPSIDPA